MFARPYDEIPAYVNKVIERIKQKNVPIDCDENTFIEKILTPLRFTKQECRDIIIPELEEHGIIKERQRGQGYSKKRLKINDEAIQ